MRKLTHRFHLRGQTVTRNLKVLQIFRGHGKGTCTASKYAFKHFANIYASNRGHPPVMHMRAPYCGHTAALIIPQSTKKVKNLKF